MFTNLYFWAARLIQVWQYRNLYDEFGMRLTPWRHLLRVARESKQHPNAKIEYDTCVVLDKRRRVYRLRYPGEGTRGYCTTSGYGLMQEAERAQIEVHAGG